MRQEFDAGGCKDGEKQEIQCHFQMEVTVFGDLSG